MQTEFFLRHFNILKWGKIVYGPFQLQLMFNKMFTLLYKNTEFGGCKCVPPIFEKGEKCDIHLPTIPEESWIFLLEQMSPDCPGDRLYSSLMLMSTLFKDRSNFDIN